MPRDFASISSPIRTRHRRISGLHRWEPTCPPRTPHGASLSLETVAHLQLLLDTPSRVPGSLSVPRSSWYSRSAPLPHRCRIPFVRAPGQDLRLPALTSDLLAMPVTLLDVLSSTSAGPSVQRLVSMPVCAASLPNPARNAGYLQVLKASKIIAGQRPGQTADFPLYSPMEMLISWQRPIIQRLRRVP